MQLYDNIDFVTLTGILWCIFWVYWIYAAKKTKKTVRQQSTWGQVIILFRQIVCYALIYVPQFAIGWLGQQVFDAKFVSGLFGSVIGIIGFLFAVWARRTLNTNWSGTITLKEHHELIQQGPYRLVRHPIYTGLMLIWLGSALALDETRGFLAFAITFWGLWNKLKQEEALLCQQFPGIYSTYKQQVKALIPFLL